MSAGTPFAGLPDYINAVGTVQVEIIVPVVVGTALLTHKVTGAHWEYVLLCQIGVTTDASVATRRPVVQILNQDGNVTMESPALNGQGANSGVNYFWYPGISAPYATGTTPQVSPLPQFVIPAGWTFRCFQQSGQPGDAFGPMILQVLQMPTGEDHQPSKRISPVPTPLVL